MTQPCPTVRVVETPHTCGPDRAVHTAALVVDRIVTSSDGQHRLEATRCDGTGVHAVVRPGPHKGLVIDGEVPGQERLTCTLDGHRLVVREVADQAHDGLPLDLAPGCARCHHALQHHGIVTPESGRCGMRGPIPGTVLLGRCRCPEFVPSEPAQRTTAGAPAKKARAPRKRKRRVEDALPPLVVDVHLPEPVELTEAGHLAAAVAAELARITPAGEDPEVTARLLRARTIAVRANLQQQGVPA